MKPTLRAVDPSEIRKPATVSRPKIARLLRRIADLAESGNPPVPSVVVDYCHTCGLRWSHWLGCTDTRRTVAPFHLPDKEK